MDEHSNEHLITAHETRMMGIEVWCEKLSRAVDSKASTKMAWGIVTTFLVISMAVVGWLWNSQIMVQTKLETYQEKLTGESGILIRIDKKLDKQGWALEQHLKGTLFSLDNNHRETKEKTR